MITTFSTRQYLHKNHFQFVTFVIYFKCINVSNANVCKPNALALDSIVYTIILHCNIVPIFSR